jgi:spore coat polysaccharide biosynthesis protein SpsF (cytidylyltransferase family)
MEIKRILDLPGRIFVACPDAEVSIYKTLCEGTDVKILGGHPENVARRMQQICNAESIFSFVRVTADNPYICFDVFSFLLEQVLRQGQCVSLFHQKALPNGTVISHISSSYIDKICVSDDKPAEEHLVLPQESDLRDLIITPPIPESLTWREGRFCLDTKEDYEYLFKSPQLSSLISVQEMKTNLPERLDVQPY